MSQRFTQGDDRNQEGEGSMTKMVTKIIRVDLLNDQRQVMQSVHFTDPDLASKFADDVLNDDGLQGIAWASTTWGIPLDQDGIDRFWKKAQERGGYYRRETAARRAVVSPRTI
jgi:hypothetical protein